MKTSDVEKQKLIDEFTARIDAWKPSGRRTGTAHIFREDRRDLSKIRTLFRRGKYMDVLHRTDSLDTIVRHRVPYDLLRYCTAKILTSPPPPLK